MIHRLVCLAVIAVLSACAVASPPVEPVPLAPATRLRLPAPAALGHAVEAVQMVTASHDGDSFTFEGRVSVKDGVLLLVTTDGLGRRATSLRWDGRELSLEKASWLPLSLPPPANMLADLMLIYWPLPALRSGLDGATLDQDGGARRLRQDGVNLVDVNRQGDGWTGSAQLVNHVWHYSLDIVSQQVSP